MKEIQKHYQSEMTRHGFTDKTFPLETDKDGNVVIHTINGKHNSDHYLEKRLTTTMFREAIEPELPFKFNNQGNRDSRDNVHLIIVRGVDMDWGNPFTIGMGFTWHHGRWGGNAVVNMRCIQQSPHHYLALIAHEIAHAFGLDPGHNNAPGSLNSGTIAWGDTTAEWANNPWGNDMRMLDFEASLLDSRPIFREINLQEDPPEPIKNPDLNLPELEQVVIKEDTSKNVVYLTIDSGTKTLPNKNGLKPFNPEGEYKNGNLWQYIRDNKAINDKAPNNRDPIIIRNTTFEKGISLIPPSATILPLMSELKYSLEGNNYIRFEGYIGITNDSIDMIGKNTEDKSCNVGGSAIFDFRIDHKKVYNRIILVTGKNPPEKINFDIPFNAKVLEITISSSIDGDGCDHASIGDAKLITNSDIRYAIKPKDKLTTSWSEIKQQ